MNKLFFGVIFALFLTACSDSGTNVNNAKFTAGVPETLFGVKLGGIYDLGEPETGNLGNLPIKKFTGVQSLLGSGLHYYFQPNSHSDFFAYKEKPKNPDDKYFPSTFRLYLFPVIPESIKTIEELRTLKPKYQVSLIEWSDKLKKDSDGYYWAVDTCKTFTAQISDIKPVISDLNNAQMYTCEFTAGGQQLVIQNLGNLVTFTLKYEKVIWDMKNDEVDKRVRQLQAKEILK
jgi:hypothetical protein